METKVEKGAIEGAGTVDSTSLVEPEVDALEDTSNDIKAMETKEGKDATETTDVDSTMMDKAEVDALEDSSNDVTVMESKTKPPLKGGRLFPESNGFWYLICIAITVAGSFFLAQLVHHQLPEPVNTYSGPDKFVAGNARKILTKLTNFGPKPAGSYANEVTAVRLLVDQIKNYQDLSSRTNTSVKVNIQHASGSLWTKYYTNIQNVIVRISRGGDNKTALLINGHFDSKDAGPGASDDSVNCAIMLEVLRVIVSSPTAQLNQDIVFLFNGAEESGLLASHAFVEQHAWAKDIRAFINLEAVGSGGRQLLFQSSSRQLMDAYIRAAPHPFANIVGQEVFQSGILPSDTDFRIFRDYGGVAGLDFAFIENGYVYHTIHDTSDKIPDGSIQQAGDNLLALAMELAKNEELGRDDNESDLVFFDLFGVFLVSYPSWGGIILNVVVAWIAVAAAAIDIFFSSKKWNIPKKNCVKEVLVCFSSNILIILLSMGVSALIGFTLGEVKSSLSWYSEPSLLFFLYCVPTLAVMFLIFSAYRVKLVNEDIVEISSFHSSTLAFSAISLLLTILGINSAFMFNFSLVFNLIWWSAMRSLSSKLHSNPWLIFLSYLMVQIIPLMLWNYITQTFLTVFIPIMGRFGTDDNPDLIMAVLISFLTTLMLQFIFPLLIKIKHHLWLSLFCTIAFIITIILIAFSGVGFPYNGDSLHPTAKRLSILHTKRTFYSQTGSVEQQDGGYLTVPTDYRTCSDLLHSVPEYSSGHWVDGADCKEKLGCGFPQLGWRGLNGVESNVWINSSPPAIPEGPPVSLELHVLSVDPQTKTSIISLEVSGPNHLTLVLSPEPGVNIISSPFSMALSGDRSSYFTQFVRGLNPQTQQLKMVVEGWQRGTPLMTASLAGHYIHGEGRLSHGKNAFVDKHPLWTTPSAFIVDYKYYDKITL